MQKQTFEQYIKTEVYSTVTSLNKRLIGSRFNDIGQLINEMVKHYKFGFETKSDSLKAISMYYEEFITFYEIGALTFNPLYYPNLANEYFIKTAIAYIITPYIPQFPFVMTEDVFKSIQDITKNTNITFDYNEVNKKFASSIITR